MTIPTQNPAALQTQPTSSGTITTQPTDPAAQDAGRSSNGQPQQGPAGGMNPGMGILMMFFAMMFGGKDMGGQMSKFMEAMGMKPPGGTAPDANGAQGVGIQPDRAAGRAGPQTAAGGQGQMTQAQIAQVPQQAVALIQKMKDDSAKLFQHLGPSQKAIIGIYADRLKDPNQMQAASQEMMQKLQPTFTGDQKVLANQLRADTQNLVGMINSSAGGPSQQVQMGQGGALTGNYNSVNAGPFNQNTQFPGMVVPGQTIQPQQAQLQQPQPQRTALVAP